MNKDVLALQRRLADLARLLGDSALSPGPRDGLWGPQTARATNKALDRLEGIKPSPSAPVAVVPALWMPQASMERIIVHWTAGGNKASSTDRKHYHILIEGDGKLVRGDKTIADNESTSDGRYAAHTRSLNTGSIGVSLCGMMSALESPFDPGPFPITATQWAVLPKVIAALCERYSIPVTPRTVLTHAEVQSTLGVAQRGKWDIAILPFDTSLNSARKVGDAMRAAAQS